MKNHDQTEYLIFGFKFNPRKFRATIIFAIVFLITILFWNVRFPLTDTGDATKGLYLGILAFGLIISFGFSVYEIFRAIPRFVRSASKQWVAIVMLLIFIGILSKYSYSQHKEIKDLDSRLSAAESTISDYGSEIDDIKFKLDR